MGRMDQGSALTALSELFKRFPSIGQRQADRFARFVASSDARYARELSRGILDLHRASRQCARCFIRHESDADVCRVCGEGDADTLVIVEKDADAHALIASVDPASSVRYFILGGLIPIVNDSVDQVRLPQLLKSVSDALPSEILIAFSVHPDADHTARHLADVLRERFPDVRISMLGRGLSSGSELEYSDPDTILNAFTRRESV